MNVERYYKAAMAAIEADDKFAEELNEMCIEFIKENGDNGQYVFESTIGDIYKKIKCMDEKVYIHTDCGTATEVDCLTFCMKLTLFNRLVSINSKKVA